MNVFVQSLFHYRICTLKSLLCFSFLGLEPRIQPPVSTNKAVIALIRSKYRDADTHITALVSFLGQLCRVGPTHYISYLRTETQSDLRNVVSNKVKTIYNLRKIDPG
jgi:hypothetical protein